MRAFHLTGPSFDSLIQVELPRPRPEADEVIIRQRATGLNYLDLVVAEGKFGHGQYPLIPGAEGAGEIVETGSRVRGWAVGDRVAPGMLVDWAAGPITADVHKRQRGVSMPGSLAEYAAVPATSLVRIPESLSYMEAATLPITATTAWNAIVKANVRPGSTVVLIGTGGVSLFALQYAKAAGARVIITSSSDAKLARARALGADDTINYQTTPAWDDAVLDLTAGAGGDLVLESVGAATFPRSLNAVATAGTIFVIGFVGGTELTIPVLPIMLKTVSIIGNNTGSTANLADAAKAIDASGIRPVIDKVFHFDHTADAYRYLKNAGHVGKVVISLDQK